MKIFNCSDGSKVNYEIIGKGTPIVFIHGWSVDLHLWKNKIERISGRWKKNYRRIYFDLPGMGKSVAASSIRNSDDMLRCIQEFLIFACGSHAYLLAGESYGGYLARGLVGFESARILGLFMLCPLVVPGARRGRVPGRTVLERDTRFLDTLSVSERSEFTYLSVVQTREYWLDYKRDIRLGIIPENEGFLENQLSGGFSDAVEIGAVRFDKPTLVLVGRQDSEVGFEDQLELYKDYPRATISVVDLAGHNLQIERRELFSASFCDWLERVERDGSAT